MPLKHPTETFLIFLLGLVTVVTGVLLTTLPELPPGILPWLIIFVLTLAYPAALYPMLRSNRADNEFRLLHFVPALMAVLWLLLSLLAIRVPAVHPLMSLSFFAWALPLVTVTFLLLVIFCLHVIRRWLTRLVLLAILFVPYVAFALGSASQHSQTIAAVLWQGSWWNITGTSPQMPQISSGKNLAASSYPEEEEWRQKLRQLEEQSSPSSSSSSMKSSSSSSKAPSSSSSIPSSSSSQSSALAYMQASSSSKPPHLPSAGPEDFAAVGASLLAIYTATLHARAKRRLK